LIDHIEERDDFYHLALSLVHMAKPSSEQLSELFDEVKDNFPFGGSYLEGKYRRLKKVVSLLPDANPEEVSVLSVGSGPCEMEAILSHIGYNVTAVDDLKDQWHVIGKNRQRIKKFAADYDVEFHMASADEDVLNNRVFDVVICLDVIEHIPNPRDLLNSIGNNLETDGYVILLTPNLAHLSNRIKLLMGKPISTRHGLIYWNIGDFRSHIKEYTVSELDDLVRWAGFEIVGRKMVNQSAYKRRSDSNIIKKNVINLYIKITKLNDRLKDTQIVKARKPVGWEPTETNIDRFSDWYSHISEYNMDNVQDKEIIQTIESEH